MATALRIVFMGSPDFSVPALAALLDAGHNVIAVYSQPPRPAGRGQKERRCPVHDFALSRNIDVRTPKSFREPGVIDEFQDLNADIAVVVAYGLILPKAVLEAPKLGCINVHASLLPRWRGAAPIQRAIAEGDSKTGVCIMQMDEGLDTGPVLLKKEIPITAGTTASDLHDMLSELGAALINPALQGLAQGTLESTPQPDQGVTYASKLDKAEGRLNWGLDAAQLERKIRAFTPWPGVWFDLNGERIKVFAAKIIPSTPPDIEPGTTIDEQLTIACASDALRPTCLQRPGKQKLALEDFLRGHPVPKGMKI
jgi:methionyl-tRNA formyltransferase